MLTDEYIPFPLAFSMLTVIVLYNISEHSVEVFERDLDSLS